MNSDECARYLSHAYGLSSVACEPFHHGVVNENYRVFAAQGNFVWKKNCHKSLERMEDELAMLQRCAALPVPHVIAGVDGGRIRAVDGAYGWLYEMIEGDMVGEHVDATLLFDVGAILARIHVACAGLEPRDRSVSWDCEGVVRLVDAYERLHGAGMFAETVDLTQVRRELLRFSFEGLPMGMTHQDVKPENILIADGAIAGVIDFDNAYFGTLLHDVHTVAIWMCCGDDGVCEDLLDALYRGYESVRRFTDAERVVLRDSLLFRLAREVFIGPWAAARVDDVVIARSERFWRVYQCIV